MLSFFNISWNNTPFFRSWVSFLTLVATGICDRLINKKEENKNSIIFLRFIFFSVNMSIYFIHFFLNTKITYKFVIELFVYFVRVYFWWNFFHLFKFKLLSVWLSFWSVLLMYFLYFFFLYCSSLLNFCGKNWSKIWEKIFWEWFIFIFKK